MARRAAPFARCATEHGPCRCRTTRDVRLNSVRLLPLHLALPGVSTPSFLLTGILDTGIVGNPAAAFHQFPRRCMRGESSAGNARLIKNHANDGMQTASANKQLRNFVKAGRR